ncbi:hypothetical protein PP914_gp001 [Arthrobacter phage Qui]|uniref:Uncharacterized protein n=1 Tax=Arthrobacter phage Qui TaxID=2603260 RepID=A0A5B8WLL9_9CAUD|nr:hypothetical protein PP914_gp001 [Arthrobacter phage Qui]QED11492.1 hypothetical protein SEA_QUI_1 [Arthrobacter phage Qui]QOC56323.1 hypothetical protein SEA_PAELLA_1 [Arthrobacter phage Paella]
MRLFSRKSKAKSAILDDMSDEEVIHLRILNLVANSPLTLTRTTPDKVVIQVELDQQEFETRTGFVFSET